MVLEITWGKCCCVWDWKLWWDLGFGNVGQALRGGSDGGGSSGGDFDGLRLRGAEEGGLQAVSLEFKARRRTGDHVGLNVNALSG